jgi:DNA-binding transcriptional ArsR family regulator
MAKGEETKEGTAESQSVPKEKFQKSAHGQLLKGLNHPVRVECLTVLAERVASPRELAEALDEDLSNVSYHVRVLSELGLIELVREEPVRGAVAHFYRAVERPLFSTEEWETVPLPVQKAVATYSWDILIKEATTAIETGSYESRPDRNFTRTSLLLDSEGFARLNRAMEELLHTILEEQAASAERRNKSGEKPIHAVAATALFAMPDPSQKEAHADA